jgi:hypothetical protein
MAIDLNRPIEIPHAQSAKDEYPSKTTMNLAVSQHPTVDVKRIIVIAVIVLVVGGLFVKFGIVDVYARVGAAQTQLNVAQSQLDAVNGQLGGYSDVEQQYQQYEKSGVSSSSSVSALKVLEMVDSVIPESSIASVDLSGTTLKLQITGESLDTIAQLSNKLSTQSMVENVSVSNAATNATNNQSTTAVLTVTLHQTSNGGAA